MEAPSPDLGSRLHAPAAHGSPSRYELRVFGARLSRVEARLRRRGRSVESGAQRKLYLLGRRPDVNLKVRDGRLEGKRRIGRRGALERWAVEISRPFPLEPDWARAALPALLGVPELPPLGEAPLSVRDLVLRVVMPLAQLEVVSVREERRRFRLGDGVRAEHATARVAGRRIETAAVEGVEPVAVRRAALLVGLEPGANTSWPAALRTLCVAPDGLRPEAAAEPMPDGGP